MASKKAKTEFDAIVKRRDELKAKRRRSTKEQTELEELETTLEVAPTADKFEELQQAFVRGRREVAEGSAVTLTTDDDFEAFRDWLKE